MEPGQDRNIAALTLNFYVHIFFGEMMNKDFIKVALEEAKIAYKLNEVPVGAVIVKNGKIIAKAHNLKRSTNNIMNHAEIIALMEASQYIGDWRLNECEMYVTLEPCSMCMGALINSRIKKLYIGTEDLKTGACGSVLNLLDYKFNHKIEVEKNILKKECEKILKEFFVFLRKRNKSEKSI